MKGSIAGVIALALFISLRSTSFKNKISGPPQLYITNSISPVETKKSNQVIAQESNNKQNITTEFITKNTAQKVNKITPKELTVDESID